MKHTIKAVVAVALALSAASCKSAPQVKETAPVQIPLVAVEKAISEVVADEQVYSSNVQPWAKNNIAPQSGGRIESLLVEVGTYVNAGETVARMDDVQLLQSELQVKNDEIEYVRIKALHEKGGVSQSDFESFELACKVHRTQYENLLKNTVLRSPLTGVISARNYDKGDMYAMAMPIYTVEQIVPVKLLIGMSESDYSRVHKGDQAEITTDAFPGRTFRGSISNIYPTIDPATHTFNVEVKVQNLDRKLRPGMYSKVNVTFGKSTRVTVSDKAVTKQQGSGDRFVYILDRASNTVRYQKVTLGKRLDNRYVILSGVKPGDEVVTEGILRIKDGSTVKVK